MATLGPATDSPATVQALVDAGVDAVRLNFSYGDHEEHGRRIDMVRAAGGAAGREIAVLQDLKGPKIRVGELEGGSVLLKARSEVVLTHRAVKGTAEQMSTTYSQLGEDVAPGDTILLDDGAIELAVDRVTRGDVVCTILRGGVLKSGKGMNLPGVNIRTAAFTEKDIADLRFGLERGIDAVALSFTRSASDAEPVRQVMRECGRSVFLLAKIESPQALHNLDGVLRSFDGVMVARGDLGVEIGPEKVPVAQKRIIARANVVGKPVITATQMLESMILNFRPTRAEASDVANAVLDGTDVVMLSGETAAGTFPVESVLEMDRIVLEAESLEAPDVAQLRSGTSRSHSICRAVVVLAQQIHASAIAVHSVSGRTTRIVSALRPSLPILALCEQQQVARSLALYRAVVPLFVGKRRAGEDITTWASAVLAERDLVPRGEYVVVVGASPDGGGGPDFIRLIRAS